MLVEFKRNWRGHKKGDLVDYEEKVAQKLQRLGLVNLALPASDPEPDEVVVIEIDDAASDEAVESEKDVTDPDFEEDADYKADKKKRRSGKK